MIGRKPMTKVERNLRHRERRRALIADLEMRLANCVAALDLITQVTNAQQARRIAEGALRDAE